MSSSSALRALHSFLQVQNITDDSEVLFNVLFQISVPYWTCIFKVRSNKEDIQLQQGFTTDVLVTSDNYVVSILLQMLHHSGDVGYPPDV